MPRILSIVPLCLVACHGVVSSDSTSEEGKSDVDSATAADGRLTDSGATDEKPTDGPLTTYEGGGVRTCAAATLGAPIVFVNFPSPASMINPPCFAIDGSFAYWGDESGMIFRCARPDCPGGPKPYIAETAIAVATDGTTFFWISKDSPTTGQWSLNSCPIADCPAGRKTLFYGTPAPDGPRDPLAADDTSLYFARQFPSSTGGLSERITLCAKDDCAATLHDTPLTTTDGYWAALAVDDSRVYGCGPPWGLEFLSKSVGAAPQVIVTPIGPAEKGGGQGCGHGGLVLDSTDLFVTGGRGTDPLLRIAKPGCCTVLGGCFDVLSSWRLPDSSGFRGLMAADESDIFYLENDARPSGLRLTRIPKHR